LDKITLKFIIGVKIAVKKYSASANKEKDSKGILGRKEIT